VVGQGHGLVAVAASQTQMCELAFRTSPCDCLAERC
jgi:hypothetical protein